MRILKHNFEMMQNDENVIEDCGRIVHVGNQSNHIPTIWFEEKPGHSQTIKMVGTGHVWDENKWSHAGSAVCGRFVWHILLPIIALKGKP